MIEHNNRMHSDHKKRRSFVALLFVSGDAKRYTHVSKSAIDKIKNSVDEFF